MQMDHSQTEVDSAKKQPNRPPIYELNKIYGINPKHRKSYFERLIFSLDITQSVFLRRKSEYGLNEMCSERGIQAMVRYYAREIAKRSGVCEDKTEIICMMTALGIPDYGSVGLAACAHYAAEKNLPWDWIDIKIAAAEYSATQSGIMMRTEIHEALCAYYENRTDIPEVNIARYCHKMAVESRALMKQGVAAADAVDRVMEKAMDNYSAEKSKMDFNETEMEVPAEVQEQFDYVMECYKEEQPEKILNAMVFWHR